MEYIYEHSILGGTFDHFHKGHKYFLDQAFLTSKHVTVGITKKHLTTDKVLAKNIDDLNVRERNLKEYLKKKKYLKRATIIHLIDIYGNCLDDNDIDTLFIIDTGVENAKIINKERKEIGFAPLKIVEVPLVKTEDGNTISSTRIRRGEIDRDGNVYGDVFNNARVLKLAEDLRLDLGKPFGKVVTRLNKESVDDRAMVITVGDIVTANVIREGIKPDICLFDLKTKREKIVDKSVLSLLPQAQITLDNEPGSILVATVKELGEIIKKSLYTSEKVAVKIIGEEDLLALPLILLAPLNSIILYGISDLGMVLVVVDEKIKSEIRSKYLSKFIKLP